MTGQRRYRAPSARCKPLEFSQRIALMIVVTSVAMPLLAILLNFALLWTGREPMTDVAVQTIAGCGITGILGGSGIYALLQGGRHISKNLSGVTLAELGAAQNDEEGVG